MTHRYTALLGPALLLALVSCGGSGSPDVTESDKTDLTGDTNGDIQSDKPPIIDVATKPFLNDEGAEEGLKGCLNRPLYFNGPHTVSVRNAVYTYAPFLDDNPALPSTTLEEEAYDYRYEVLKVSDDGVSEVDIMFTVNNSNGTGSGSLPYVLDGYDLISIVNRLNPEPNPRTLFFDMEKGVDYPHAYNAGTANQPFFLDSLKCL